MNPNAQFERDLEQWLQTEAPASAPAGFHASVMDRARTLRQRPSWATSFPVRRFGRGASLDTIRGRSPVGRRRGAGRRGPASCACRRSYRPCLLHRSLPSQRHRQMQCPRALVNWRHHPLLRSLSRVLEASGSRPGQWWTPRDGIRRCATSGRLGAGWWAAAVEWNPSDPATADLYDPENGTWSATGSMINIS